MAAPDVHRFISLMLRIHGTNRGYNSTVRSAVRSLLRDHLANAARPTDTEWILVTIERNLRHLSGQLEHILQTFVHNWREMSLGLVGQLDLEAVHWGVLMNVADSDRVIWKFTYHRYTRSIPDPKPSQSCFVLIERLIFSVDKHTLNLFLNQLCDTGKL